MNLVQSPIPGDHAPITGGTNIIHCPVWRYFLVYTPSPTDCPCIILCNVLWVIAITQCIAELHVWLVWCKTLYIANSLHSMSRTCDSSAAEFHYPVPHVRLMKREFSPMNNAIFMLCYVEVLPLFFSMEMCTCLEHTYYTHVCMCNNLLCLHVHCYAYGVEYV